MKYLIIGNSAAAVGAIEAIRSQDRTNPITVISDEPYLTYSRPLISYLLAGQVSQENMFYREKDFYEKNMVEARLGEKAISVDPESKSITLETGEKLFFNKLLVATGGTPIFPEVEGRDLGGVFTFTRWDDAERIMEFMARNRIEKAVVVGGGLIGLKAAEALVERGVKVTVVELADRTLSITFDHQAAAMVEGYLEERGVDITTDNTVSLIKGDNSKVEKVILKDQREVQCQLLIFAIGVRPNIDLVRGTSIRVNRGIVVNKYLETSVPDIYAAGDVAEAFDLVMGIDRPIPIWPSAYIQGTVAGYNMAGLPREYGGWFAMNSVEICGLPTISVGLTVPPEDGYEILEDHHPQELTYRKIVLKDDLVVGAIFIGRIDRAGIITGLIKDRVKVTSFREHLLREDFGLVWLPKEYRKHMVSGVGVEV
ncbi:hypothetical protein HKBW3S43_01096 [Candidatus Hakubella thermalkaliphila]|uniref:NAD(P)/FAD-dependent oxidoreductase n=1 Tax=Candidatus Hakubella thermalkaliphila TaxID=2754717 RepID=A0A6V8PTW4_9ACTN|nr:FAD-dependent oxidoreductase [Candidatus Hakubella thermalkaliphila]GFP25184.1 hypothetical protein HKBW3S25_00642 [Candidatus Hakubella thermalkaliphila]GFP27265.1 hypothetical protein HKBW3S33_00679 [Candidatus Hakubella thermalkaliphila]GFP35304.1 hypothetical protein HKBW3S43_01096 [Candidatus Hakubella thermalkaliphila]